MGKIARSMATKKTISERLDPSQYLKMGIHTYRGKLIVQLSFWIAAIAVGVIAVFFTRGAQFMQHEYEQVFVLHPWLLLVLTPLGFLIANWVCQFAPQSRGSARRLFYPSRCGFGTIPQVPRGTRRAYYAGTGYPLAAGAAQQRIRHFRASHSGIRTDRQRQRFPLPRRRRPRL